MLESANPRLIIVIPECRRLKEHCIAQLLRLSIDLLGEEGVQIQLKIEKLVLRLVG